MRNTDDADDLFSALRALPTEPPSRALSARVLERAHAALAAEPATTPVTTWAVASAVVAAVAVYLSWAVDFLTQLANT